MNKSLQPIIIFRKIIIGLGAISFILVALLVIVAWLYGIGDFFAFQFELGKEISKIPSEGITVPTHERSGHTFVSGVLNGKQKIEMEVDTGCGNCIIDRSFANELKLPLRFKRSAESPEQSQDLQQAIIPELKIGSLTLRSLPVEIADLRSLSFINGHQIDGFLGNFVIRQLATTFDSRLNVIVFRASNKFRIPPKAFKIKCITEHWVPKVTARLRNKIEQIFDIDTGANFSLLPRTVSKQLNLQVIPIGQAYYASGLARNHGQVTVSEFNLGELKIPNMCFNVDLAGGKAENVALLGNDFLNKYRFTLNQTKKVLFLEPYAISTPDKIRTRR